MAIRGPWTILRGVEKHEYAIEAISGFSSPHATRRARPSSHPNNNYKSLDEAPHLGSTETGEQKADLQMTGSEPQTTGSTGYSPVRHWRIIARAGRAQSRGPNGVANVNKVAILHRQDGWYSIVSQWTEGFVCAPD